MTNLEKLQSALVTWDSADDLGASPDDLACNVLELAEIAVREEELQVAGHATWHDFLDITRRSPYLLALQDSSRRELWAEVCFVAIRRSEFTFAKLLTQRVARHPDRPLFRHADAPPGAAWSYAQVLSQARRFASTFLMMCRGTPHVALWAANSIQGACCDLACLAFDIPVTPISTRADDEELSEIHNAVPVDIAITDSPDRYAQLVDLRRRSERGFRILRLDATSESLEANDNHLLHAQAELGIEDIEATLSRRKRLGLDDTSTTMFTPGPSGRPKGIAFSSYNLMTKRFARAAALPRIGEEELFLCYLPLFHTFGRFFEMMGSAFWGGTYVFASDPSLESLRSGLRKVRPTSHIGIPLRWSQIHRSILDVAGPNADDQALHQACARVTGGRLRWGLSAAGYLEPEVFKFFHRMGIALCSGFGMTEATGGVTMTPPHEYVEGSIGIALPGMRMKLAKSSELLIAGPYVARALDDPAPASCEERMTPTGDLFRLMANGHYQIFDKIKDIYKNSRGQTIAPKRVENLFGGVPEVRRVMLVGDGKDDNTLLIFSNPNASCLRGLDEVGLRTFFRKIVLKANQALAHHERIVDFRVLHHEPTRETGEVIDDGNLHRKTVLAEHRRLVGEMYADRAIDFPFGSLTIRVPRWLFRDLGVLLDDIRADRFGLVDEVSGRVLRIEPLGTSRARIGDFVYSLQDTIIDLGRLARQPALWMGNAGLAEFFPCKEGWDVTAREIGLAPQLPADNLPSIHDTRPVSSGHDDRLRDAHRLSVLAFGSDEALAATAVECLGDLLSRGHDRLDRVIRRRLQALAEHPHAEVRGRAFQALIAHGDDVDGRPPMMAFLSSGRSFLSDDTLTYIDTHRIERRTLETLGNALRACRTLLPVETDPVVRDQIEHVFECLVRVSRRDFSWWSAVRQELAGWTLPQIDPALAALANGCLARLHRTQAARVASDVNGIDWRQEPTIMPTLMPTLTPTLMPTLMPELGAHPSDTQLQDVLTDHRFLARSAAVLTGTSPRDFRETTGLVVSREPAAGRAAVRVGWTARGAHADMILTALHDDLDAATNSRWQLALRGAPAPWPLVPAMGLWHERRDVVSSELVDAPSVWDRIRTLATAGGLDSDDRGDDAWRALFVRGMAAWIRIWDATGRTRLGRNAGPANVLINLPDIAEHGCVREADLGGGPTSFAGVVETLGREFYERARRHYPWCQQRLMDRWLFDACVEALGVDQAEQVLGAYVQEDHDGPWLKSAKRYMDSNAARTMFPLAAEHAVLCYKEWLHENDGATIRAKAQMAKALYRAHGLERFAPVVGYRALRESVFVDGSGRVLEAFDALIEAMMCRDCAALDLVQLTELQDAVQSQDMRDVLRHLVFPQAHPVWCPGPALQERRRGTRGTSELVDATGRVYTLRFTRHGRDVSAVLHQAWKAGLVRSFWSDEIAAAAWDHRNRAVGGLLLHRTRHGDFVFDGPFIAEHLQGCGLDKALIRALRKHAAGRHAPSVCAVRRHPVRAECAWKTDRSWGGYVERPSTTD